MRFLDRYKAPAPMVLHPSCSTPDLEQQLADSRAEDDGDERSDGELLGGLLEGHGASALAASVVDRGNLVLGELEEGHLEVALETLELRRGGNGNATVRDDPGDWWTMR